MFILLFMPKIKATIRQLCCSINQVLWQSLPSFVLPTPLILINSRSHTDSPGIVPSHPADALRTLQILLPYLTSNKWFAAKVNTLKLPVIY
ncbi:hypothetical protein, partial [Escherichia coli]|uniref:hypothetical protein n=1 Tax=Escherichia coli TaxID=562 RepID=UPI0020CD98ED